MRVTRQAFSLLEMAFVLILMAGIVGVLYQIFYTQTSTSRRLETHQEALRAGLFALDIVSRDLKQLVTVPVERNRDGTVRRQYGDAVTPCKISPMGRQISFYVAENHPTSIRTPESPCRTLTYSLWPAAAPGTYGVRRTIGPVPGLTHEETVVAPPRGDATDHLLGEVLLSDMRFRLLEPGCLVAKRRSPDSGYYVEITLTGVDRGERVRRELPGLVHLDYPSQQATAAFLCPRITYAPAHPLLTPPETFRPTASELALVERLRRLTRQFTTGKLAAAEFSDSIRKILETHAGDPVTALVGGTGTRIPNFANLSVRPYEKGQPIQLASSDGQLLSLLTDPTQAAGLMTQLQRLMGTATANATAATAGTLPPPIDRAAIARSWWVDLSSDRGHSLDLAGLLGTVDNSYGPLATTGRPQ